MRSQKSTLKSFFYLLTYLLTCDTSVLQTLIVIVSSCLARSGTEQRRTQVYITDGEFRNDLYCVEWGVKLYSLTQLNHDVCELGYMHG